MGPPGDATPGHAWIACAIAGTPGRMASGSDAATLDWSHAEVRGGRLMLPLTEKASKAWVKAMESVLARLGADHGVEVGRERLEVDVAAGEEDDVRHRLESAVLEANARLAEDRDEGEGAAASDADRAMTAAFRAFGED
jgi:hypothetical protein